MELFRIIQSVETTYWQWQDFQFQPIPNKILYPFLAITEKIQLYMHWATSREREREREKSLVTESNTLMLLLVPMCLHLHYNPSNAPNETAKRRKSSSPNYNIKQETMNIKIIQDTIQVKLWLHLSYSYFA